ncbi:MAG: hypothetical protein IJG80_01050 [Selenomonadaceae bacterium]|nr:hypothetical protein [Selenomonadaceae bacterium]MBQ3727257.1 hypothetical protein [Selenomonadaceae bacterium]MBQ9497246.1 hypothetical protein [Selenomonadaceae bacterium]
MTFIFLNQLSLCLSKEKVAKRKDPSQGRLLANGLEVETTRNVELPAEKTSRLQRGRAVIHDGSKVRQRKIFLRR